MIEAPENQEMTTTQMTNLLRRMMRAAGGKEMEGRPPPGEMERLLSRLSKRQRSRRASAHSSRSSGKRVDHLLVVVLPLAADLLLTDTVVNDEMMKDLYRLPYE